MTGHAEDKWVQLPQQVTICRCCPNAVKESRSERVGLYRNEQRGFACLVDQQGGTTPQAGTLEHSPEQDLSRRNGVEIKHKYMQQYDA